MAEQEHAHAEEEAEFDEIAHDYEAMLAENVKSSGFTPAYFVERKIAEIANFLKSRGLADQRINFLNFGCGVGYTESLIRKTLPQSVIYGTDISRRSIELAVARNTDVSDCHFAPFRNGAIPFDAPIDVLMVANVFHHVPREQHLALLREFRRVLARGGYVFMFENNPINPVTVHMVKTCPFDKNAVLLNPLYARRIFKEAGFESRTIRFTLFFPKLLSFLIPFEKFLRWNPFGAQYYIIARKDK